MTPKTKGYLLGIVAAATYGMNPLFALPLYSAGMSVDSVLFLRYLIAIPILGAMIQFRRRSFFVTRRQLWLLVLFGLLMAVSSLTLFMSYNYMDAGIASTILFVYPVIVALIMAGVFHERISAMLIFCMALAISGIGMLYKSPVDGASSASFSVVGMLLVLTSSFTYALYMVLVNRTSVQRLPTLVISFYVLLFGLSLFATRLWNSGDFFCPGPGQWQLWVCILSLAFFPTVVSFVCTTTAIQCVGSTATALLGSLEPVTAVIIGVTVFGEVLTPRDVLGLLMIVSSVSLVVGASKVSAPLMRIRRMFPSLRHRVK